MKTVRLLAACGVVATASAAHATIIPFNFVLTGDQEVPPVQTNAVGSAQLLYDTTTQTFDLDMMVFGIDMADLLGTGPNNTPVHIHNAPAGANGPIVIDIGDMASFQPDGLGIRFQLQNAPIGVYEPELLAFELYVNIHTANHPAGEIRGQIVPTPASLALLGFGGLMAVSRRRRA